MEGRKGAGAPIVDGHPSKVGPKITAFEPSIRQRRSNLAGRSVPHVMQTAASPAIREVTSERCERVDMPIDRSAGLGRHRCPACSGGFSRHLGAQE